MPKVTLLKAARFPLGSRQVHPSGTVLDVSDADAKALLERSLIAEESEPEPAPEPEAGKPEPEPEKEPEPGQVSTAYGPLPAKTAPVAIWKEYARSNGIKLTGLTKRNEIMGFITKTVQAD